MLTISAFYGIVIQMFWADHAPPHFHALYSEYEALVNMRTLEVMQGSLPGRHCPGAGVGYATPWRAIGELGLMRKEAALEQNTSARVTPSVPWRLKDVKALSGYRLKVCFQDGLEGTVDMSALVWSENAGVFAALRDETVFRQVFLEYGAVTWPGEIDLAPDAMYEEIQKNVAWLLT